MAIDKKELFTGIVMVLMGLFTGLFFYFIGSLVGATEGGNNFWAPIIWFIGTLPMLWLIREGVKSFKAM